jgi:ribonuclease D
MKQAPILSRDDQLVDLARQLAGEPVIAVDLEADSMHNYREKVCLIQVTADGRTLLIDPLPITSLDPLKPILADPSIRKIFHAADYDLRCLYRDFGIEVHGLFDTMICAQLLGEEKIGLADLLAKYFNVNLDKRFQRADWSKRPLSKEMVAYAAEDTRHLLRLAEMFESRLKELGRLAWAQEEFALQEEVRFTDSNGPLFLRVKGAANLEPRQLGILEELLAWRETEAERRDLPPFKVIGNKELVALAQAAPATRQALCDIPGISPRHVDRLGQKLLAAILRGGQIPEADLPAYPRQAIRQRREPQVERRLEQLKKWRTSAADSLRLDPGVLINNALLEELAKHNPQSPADLDAIPGLKNWQRRELGEGILKRLA